MQTLDMLADTIAQSEHRRDKPRDCVQILSSVRFFFYCVLSSLLPVQSIGWSNFDKGLHNLIMLIQK